ncbi:MAG TPA: hypothetical protein VNZ86_18490 [Bacteroidia bacterium]|nr:hypothetical protein [Bacteroidia bacterium]
MIPVSVDGGRPCDPDDNTYLCGWRMTMRYPTMIPTSVDGGWPCDPDDDTYLCGWRMAM